MRIVRALEMKGDNGSLLCGLLPPAYNPIPLMRKTDKFQLKGILQDLTNATQNSQVHPKQGTL
jgi:hypothetical protein